MAAAAASCKLLTSGLLFLLPPSTLLTSLLAWPKKPSCDCCEEEAVDAIDCWLSLRGSGITSDLLDCYTYNSSVSSVASLEVKG